MGGSPNSGTFAKFNPDRTLAVTGETRQVGGIEEGLNRLPSDGPPIQTTCGCAGCLEAALRNSIKPTEVIIFINQN